jgi:hypothetical protein
MTAQQRKLAAAARACKGTGKIGSASRTRCIVSHLGEGYARRRKRRR